MGQIDVSYGIIHLVEIFGIIIINGHTFQLAYHLAAVVLGQHLGLGYAGVELQLVRRTQSHHVLKGIVGLLLVSQQILNLSQKEPFARPLHLAALVLDGLLQIWNSLLVFAHVDVVVGVGIVPILHGTEIHRIATHITNHVLSIVSPIEFGVALCEPRAGQSAHQWLPLIEACHIRECSGRLFELSHLELGLSHHQPSLPEEWIILSTLLLDAVAMNGLLHLFDGALVVRLAYSATRLIANGVKRNQFGVVIFVALLFFEITIDKGHVSIIIGIIAGVESVPEARLGCVFMRRTTNYRTCDSHN